MTNLERIIGHILGLDLSGPRLLGRADLRGYQRLTIDRIKGIWGENGPPGLIVALEPGAGKTTSTLTAIDDLLRAGKIKRPLVTGPLLVSQTVWHREAESWSHLKHLTFSLVIGTEKQRIAALAKPADIYVCNREVLPWLWDHCSHDWPFDALFIDEASMLKNGRKRTPKRKLTRFGAVAQMRKHLKGVVELTGTPAPNGIQNLWGLTYIIDQGARLGATKQAFNERWMVPKRGYGAGGDTYTTYTVREGSEAQILDKIKDVMISLDPKDYAELPPMVENEIKVHLPEKIMREYRRFKQTLVYDPLKIEAAQAAVLTNKLLQAANGSLIDAEGTAHWLHDCKLDALDTLHDEVAGAPMLVAYSYKFDKERIKRRFPHAVILNEERDVMATVDRWNAGEIDMLLAHPLSAGHGLNIQRGSNISVWYGLTSDLELFQQFNKRLWRPGQKAERVWSHRIIAVGTHDEAILPILNDKSAVQSRVLHATKVALSGSYSTNA